MTVKEIVRDYLKKHGYDGLWDDDCGCGVDDLFPCGEGYEHCEAGYARPAPEGSGVDEFIGPEKPDQPQKGHPDGQES